MALPARAGTHLEYTAGGYLVPAKRPANDVFATNGTPGRRRLAVPVTRQDAMAPEGWQEERIEERRRRKSCPYCTPVWLT